MNKLVDFIVITLACVVITHTHNEPVGSSCVIFTRVTIVI